MLLALALVGIVNGVLAAASPHLARALPPGVCARVIAGCALAATTATFFVLGVCAFGFLAQAPTVAAAGQWSEVSLNRHGPVPVCLGAPVCLVLAASAWSVIRRARRLIAELWSAAALGRQPATHGDWLVVLDDPRPDAYAVPGIWGGRVVVTRSMLLALEADERRVLLAHETSHLRRRHHLYLTVTELAASANPMLRGLPLLLRASIERWADEDAATAVGDRSLVARALARASLAAAGSPAAVRNHAFAMTGASVTERAAALLRPAPRPRPSLVVAAAGLALVAAAGALEASHVTEHRFENAHAAYLRR